MAKSGSRQAGRGATVATGSVPMNTLSGIITGIADVRGSIQYLQIRGQGAIVGGFPEKPSGEKYTVAESNILDSVLSRLSNTMDRVRRVPDLPVEHQHTVLSALGAMFDREIITPISRLRTTHRDLSSVLASLEKISSAMNTGR